MSMLFRFQYINYLKAVSIFLVIVLHATATGMAIFTDKSDWYTLLVLNTITRVAVPLFFVCSGAMILRRDKVSEYSPFSKFGKRIKKVVYPFIFWCIIYECNLIYHGVNKTLYNIVEDILLNNVCYHLWYVYSLIGIYLIAIFLENIKFNANTINWSLGLILTISFIQSLRWLGGGELTPLMNYFIIPVLLFIYGGALVNLKINVKSSLLCITSIVMFLITVYLMVMYNNEIYYSNGFITIVIETGCVFLLLRNMEYKLFKYVKFNKTIDYIGNKLLYGIYLSHAIVLSCVHDYAYMHGFINSDYLLLSYMLLSLIVLVLSSILILLFNQIENYMKKC